MTSGMDLRLRRVAADVKAIELAAAFEPPVTSSRVGHIEKSRTVTPEAEAKYLAALDKCTKNSTTVQEAA